MECESESGSNATNIFIYPKNIGRKISNDYIDVHEKCAFPETDSTETEPKRWFQSVISQKYDKYLKANKKERNNIKKDIFQDTSSITGMRNLFS